MPTKRPPTGQRDQQKSNRAASMKAPDAQARERRATKPPPMGLVATGSKSDILPSYTRVNPYYAIVQGRKILSNPDPIVREESNGIGVAVYEEILDKDGHASGVVETRITAATTLPRTIRPGSETPEAEAIAATVQLAFDRWDTFEEDAGNLLYCVVRGYAIGEAEYVIHPDGVVGIKRLHDCDPGAFVFDADWKLRMLTKGQPQGGVDLPDRKFVVSRYRPRYLNPYGVGIGRSLWWLLYLKKRGLISWLIAIEKYGVPTLVFKHPIGLSTTKRQALIDAGNKLQTDTTLAISDDIDVDTLKAVISAAGGGQESLELFLNDEISKRVLGQTGTTDAKAQGVGSGAADVQAAVRQDILEHDTGQVLAPSLNRTIVRWLTEFNYGPGLPIELIPTLAINATPPDDTSRLSERDERLVRMGLKVPEWYFYERYAIPEPMEGEAIINDALTAQEKATMPQGLDPNGDPMDPKDDADDEDGE